MPIQLNALEPIETITSLYVGYFNRAPDPEGLRYWIGRLEDGMSISAIADSFSVQPEATSTYPFLAEPNLDNAEVFLQQIYTNLFNRSEDVNSDGFQYWLDQLTAEGADIGQIITNIISGAQGDDAVTVLNKVAAGADFAVSIEAQNITTFSADLNVEAYTLAHSIIEGVTADASTVAAAMSLTGDLIDDLIASPVTPVEAGLAALADAQTALEARLEALELDTTGDGEIDVVAGDADRTDVTLALTAAEGVVDEQLVNFGFADGAFEVASANVQAAYIADARADAQLNIASLETAVQTAEAEAGTALLSALSVVESRETVLEQAIEAAKAASVVEDGLRAQFDAVNEGTLLFADSDSDSENDTLVLSADGVVDSADPVLATLVNDVWVANANADLSGLVGFDAYFASLQAQESAQDRVEIAEVRLNEAVRTVLTIEGDTISTPADVVSDLDGDGDVTIDFSTTTADDAEAVLTARGNLSTAMENLADLNEAVAAYEAAVALDAGLTGLEEAITAAREAVGNTVEDGGLGVDIREGAENFTVEDDVYLFNAEASEAQSLTGFGFDGDDSIFFGEGYDLVELADGWTPTANTGNASELEIFYEQVGGNLVLYVENETFAGNASSNADITTLTLVGVDAADVSLQGGFLTSATDADAIV